MTGRCERLTPHLWRVGGDSWNGTVRPLSADGDANVYLLTGDGPPALIDCGTLPGQEQIAANLRQAGVAPDAVGQILLTHSHWDHSEAAGFWQRTYRVEILLSAIGASYLERSDLRLTGAPLHGPSYTFERFAVDVPIDDGQALNVAGHEMTAYSLPGHTPDSTLFTFALDGLRVGVCGDIAFNRSKDGTYLVGLLCGLWQSNLDDYANSLTKMASIPLDLAIPGHGHVLQGTQAIQDAVHGALEVVQRLRDDPAVRRNTDF
jgi:glyoxylase-like metal-dependent hydrolase (beta-lactamase superfamily II)